MTVARELLLAVKSGDLQKVASMISNMPNVDMALPYTTGQSALIVAAEHGHTDIVELLLSAGARIHFVDSRRQTALHVAMGRNRVEVVSFLSEAQM